MKYSFTALFILIGLAHSYGQLSAENDPSLFHFGTPLQMLHGEYRGKIDYAESCNSTSKVVSIKFKDHIYVAWTGVLSSINFACLGSTHQKELVEDDKLIDYNVYHGFEDTLGGFAYSNYSPAMIVYHDSLYIYYNNQKDNKIHYLAVGQEGTVKVARRGVIPNSPDNLININTFYYPRADAVLFVGRDKDDSHIRFLGIGKTDIGPIQIHWPFQKIVLDMKLNETCVGTVGICEATNDRYLLAWTGTDSGHQLNSAFLDKSSFALADKHTYNDHSSHIDGPLLFRKDNVDDKDVHILWRGANDDTKVWQGVINLDNKNSFKQFSLPTNIAVANLTPTLISLNEMITYMIWPTADGTGFISSYFNIMMAKALDYPYEGWMGALLKDEHTLKNMVIPGSNNAGMNDVTQVSNGTTIYSDLKMPDFGQCNQCGFVTQPTDVKAQLNMGYRYLGLDISNSHYTKIDIGPFKFFDDENVLHNSVEPVDATASACLGEGLTTILQTATDFLTNHPKEFIIINLKNLNPAMYSFSSIIDDLTKTLAPFKSRFYQPDNEKTFADLVNKPIRAFRGKIILTATDEQIASRFGLIQDIFETSTSSQYRYINPTNTRPDHLATNQRNFFANSAYTGSYKRMDWQVNLKQNKLLCDMRPLQNCFQAPKPGLWHHIWHIAKCAADVGKMGYTVFKAIAEPEDPRNLITILGWMMSAFGESSMSKVDKANRLLYPTLYDLQKSGTIRPGNLVNIIYTDASDYLYTDLCMQLLTDFNEYDEVSVYNGQMQVSDQHLSVSCSAPNSGVASVTVQGGYPPYKYHWVSTGDTTATTTGLTEGYHKVRITDAMGHRVTRNVYVSMSAYAHSGLASRSMSKTEVQPYGLSNHYEADCDNLIARVESDYTTTAVADTLTASVWIDPIQGTQYVKRHYQLIPSRNASTASARVTLYFTQPEFDAYNKANTTYKLPKQASDSVGIRNLMIWQKPGRSADNSGLLNSYTGNVRELFPKPSDVVWNALAQRWEVSFYTEGFGAYFLTTYNSQQPNEWISTNAYMQKGKPVVQWEVVEKGVAQYYVDYSYDREHFEQAGVVTSKGRGRNTYEFYHQNLPKLIDSSGQGIVYYRIMQLTYSGEVSYSEIMPVDYSKDRSLFVYPNPVASELTIQSNAETQVMVYDLSGRSTTTVLLQKGKNVLPTNIWTSGMYILRTNDGEFYKIIKQ
ncbi:T9SS type A sorting domain-containing protein [Spirosoma panaciterrae]|uniref:T9SS type A sorting domain-containing protein n=1 Tax=Spirosoma panaciterrae TaxID=496058 RepID=UPI0003724B4A|nr:T9SS type A sorting domain-containing protein [Spirosoma panaciterrae]